MHKNSTKSKNPEVNLQDFKIKLVYKLFFNESFGNNSFTVINFK